MSSRDIVAGAYDAILAGDVKGFLGIFDPDAVVREPACLPYGGTFTGMQEIMGMLGKAGPVLDAGKMTVAAVYGEGDRVTALLEIPLRDGGGVADIAELWTLNEAGKVTELRVYWSDPTIVG